MTVVFGGGGVGKTTLLSAIATTRPGHAVAQQTGVGGQPGYVVCDWSLGRDDSERPHPLRVATPTLRLDEDEHREAFRRREQALFDKVSRRGGFVWMALSSARWFSKQPVGLGAPERTVARYDVRASTSLDDASRADLTRETKQSLAYAELTGALGRARAGTDGGFSLLGDAMQMAVDALIGLAGYRYVGLDIASFEPLFESDDGEVLVFDTLPRHVRHLTAFAALPVRCLWAAYPGKDPRQSEGVVAIDEVDLHQDAVIQSRLVAALREALPEVQWIVTTSSPLVAGSAESREVVALRRLPSEPRVEIHTGTEARVH